MAAPEPSNPKQFLGQVKIAVIAVVDADGNPWAVPIAVQRYKNHTIEWFSKTDTVHSRAIERHSDIALTAYVSDPMYGICATARAKKILSLPGGTARYAAEITDAWYNTSKHVKTHIDPKDL